MEENKEYYAFISYKSEDVEWAIWLQHELEHYHLPASFNGRTDIRQELRPVFRDIDELSAGNLPEQIKRSLENSQNLIVVCSPQAAASPWVNQEVETFISLGRTDRIFPFIVEGHPYANDEKEECFPKALRNLPPKEERLGGDATKQGRDMAFVKVVSGMLNVSFDSLWNRYEKEKAEEERKQREQRDNLLRVQSRFIAEKAEKALSLGDSNLSKLLALNVLPRNISNPNRPYTPEAELLLRNSFLCNCRLYKSDERLSYARFSPEHKHIIASLEEYTYEIWDVATGECVNKNLNNFFSKHISYSADGKRIVSTKYLDGDICIWNAVTNELLQVIKTREENIRYVEYINKDKDLLIKTDYHTIIWSIKKRKIIKTNQFGYFNPTKSAVCIKEKVCCISSRNNVVVKGLYTDTILFEKIEQGNHPVDCVTISPDGKLVGYVINDKMRIYDIRQNQLVFELDNVPTPVVSLKINAECDTLAIGYFNQAKRGVEIWNMVKKEQLTSFQEDIDVYSILEFAKDSETILICHPCRKCIKLIDYCKTSDIIHKKGHGDSVVAWGVDKDEQLAATADRMGVVTLWNIEKKCKLVSFDTTLQEIKHLAVSAKENQIVIVSGTDIDINGKYMLRIEQDDENIHSLVTVWDLKGNLINITKRLKNYPSEVMLASNGCWLVAESLQNVIIYKNRNNYFKKTWIIDGIQVNFMTSKHNGNIIAISSYDNSSIEVYNIETHEHLNCYDCGGINPTCISISPKENYIAAGLENGFIYVWSLRTKELVSVWKASSSMVESIVFSFDEEKIISYSLELNAWDVKTGRIVQIIDNHVGLGGGIGMYKQSLAFVNTQTVMLVTTDGISFYTFKPLQELIDEVQKQIGRRKLSEEESRLYYLE